METGQCKCKPQYKGRTCSECSEGYEYFEGMCEECYCGLASKSDVCDPFSGECECEPGSLPPKCDECQSHHYNLTEEGCTGKQKILFYFTFELIIYSYVHYNPHYCQKLRKFFFFFF